MHTPGTQVFWAEEPLHRESGPTSELHIRSGTVRNKRPNGDLVVATDDTPTAIELEDSE